jgi:hypothetical protein
MPKISFPDLQQHVLARLEQGLSPLLTYHSVAHTLDVLTQVEAIAKEEAVTDEEEVLLLKAGALYHDTGFLETYQQHEEKGVEIAKVELPQFGFTTTQVNTICSLIMATKIPQNPETKLQQIMCDADLDYLGRSDFFEIGNNLYLEFLRYGVVTNEVEWNQLQVRFLESHRFFTLFSKSNREAQKQIHLNMIRVKLPH